ncbi:MAG TPA: glutathione S-transferase family protein [Mesorhizobium sp.]|jgi:glutathione S-transferase|nr:glutathione S-transferase family protein [Mesorhizobium sp.]
MPEQTYILYGRAGTGSAAVEAFFEEAGVAYALVASESDAQGRPDPRLLALNPLGQVPVLVLPSGDVLTESAAILIYLADRHPDSAYAPAQNSPLRAKFLRWMVFMAANTYAAIIRLHAPARHTADSAGAEGVRRASSEDLSRQFAILAEELGEGPWLLGETYSALDPYLAMLIAWVEDVPGVFRRHPGLAAHFARVKARPAIGPIWRRHGMDF